MVLGVDMFSDAKQWRTTSSSRISRILIGFIFIFISFANMRVMQGIEQGRVGPGERRRRRREGDEDDGRHSV